MTTPEHSGFTALVTLGFGIQRDSVLEESATGLAGLNVGAGVFLNERTAVLFRLSGTNVTYGDDDDFSELNQVSGVVGGSIQHWISNRLWVEGGAGVGFWKVEDVSDQGFGLILGAGAVLLSSGRNNIHVGFEYAPAFVEDGAVHNVGVVVGYQFAR